MKIIKEKLLHLFLKEQRKFLLLVKPLGVLSKSKLFLVIFVSLVTVLTLPNFPFISHARFYMVQDWECMVQLSDENHNKLAMKGKFNSLFKVEFFLFFLSKKRLSDCLRHSASLDCLNLCPTSSEVQSTQYLPTQSGDLECFNCNDELSFDMSNFDSGILKRNPSPDSNDFLADLPSEFKIDNK